MVKIKCRFQSRINLSSWLNQEASMAPSSSIQFIDTALCCTSPFALSYTDPDQKWLIRKHLHSLLEDYPSFIPSSDSFTHNDGTTVNLLNASGYLQVSRSKPPIHLTIWLHENYPFMPPIVFISSNSMNPIHQDHPFVDPSGAVRCAYLQTWSYSRFNLSSLLHNLVKIFSHDHPFSYSSSPGSSFSHPSSVSKMEGLERLLGMLHYDMVALQSKTAEEIEELSILQIEMKKRADDIENIVMGLKQERGNLKEKVTELTEKGDVLRNWLKVNDPKPVEIIAGYEMEDAFEVVGEESKFVLDGLAADKAVEDVIYALDKALEQGVVTFDSYIKQVRKLAKEQFFHRDLLVKLRGTDILLYI